MSALRSAGASLTPSPVIATTSPRPCSARTMRMLCYAEPARPPDGDDLPGPAVRAAPLLHGRRRRSSRPTGCHPDASKKAARAHAIDLLGRVGIPQPSSRVDDYPHNFSGGMRQRAMIAMALASDPDLLIADEPTTALDVTVQAQILDLILDLQAEFDSAVMLITHDLGVVAEVADDILVMYAGRGVEYGPATEVFSAPAHPYTWGLLESVPALRPGAAGPAACRSPAARRACSPRRRAARSTRAAATAS